MFQIDYSPNFDVDSNELKLISNGVSPVPVLGILEAATAWHRESEPKQGDEGVGKGQGTVALHDMLKLKEVEEDRSQGGKWG